MHAQKLKKQERLKLETSITELFNSGKSNKSYPVRIVYRKFPSINPQHPVKFAVSVPKKKVKLAVQRNRIKRKIRTFYRLNKQTLIEACQRNQVNIDLMFVFIGTDVAHIDKAERSMTELLNHLVNDLS